jgi:hypothetical protein
VKPGGPAADAKLGALEKSGTPRSPDGALLGMSVKLFNAVSLSPRIARFCVGQDIRLDGMTSRWHARTGLAGSCAVPHQEEAQHGPGIERDRRFQSILEAAALDLSNIGQLEGLCG